MPYTAPSKQSPPAQQTERSHHNRHPDSIKVLQAPSGRRHLPRSYSSTSYVRRHRRSPSINKSLLLPAVESSTKSNYAVDPHASLRQSPPPLNDSSIPPGAVISPPESLPNSSDEDLPYQEPNGFHLGELEVAIRSMERNRESSTENRHPEEKLEAPNRSSPNKMRIDIHGKSPDILPSQSSASSDKPLASKELLITHSPDDPFTSSPEESERDDEPKKKPPMVRKKSGELVRPALRPPAHRRPSSMPGTPTYSKAVHFDSQLEHIRHFLQLDKPLAVSAETSPVEDHDNESEFPFSNDGTEGPSFEWELRLSNFPKGLPSQIHKPVRLERISLSSDKNNLLGVVAVANIAYQKSVAARFTFDYWKTVSEVAAEYTHDVRRKHAHDGFDRFAFSIKLADQANLENKTMFACVRYNVGGKEYWDNNNSMNYQVDFLKKPKSKPEQRVSPSGPRPPLPRSRSFAGSHVSRPHSMPPSFDDFSDMDSYLTFGRSDLIKGQHLPRDASDDVEPVTPTRRDKQARQAFGNRYDFGASLSAAIRTKPTHDRTTLTARAKSGKDDPEAFETQKDARLLVDKATPVSEITRRNAHPERSKSSALVSDKPHHESTVYKELVDKYCFYGSPKSTPDHKRHPTPNKVEPSTRKHNSNALIATSSSASPSLSPRVEPAHNTNHREARSRSTSPASPNSSYSYHQSIQSLFLKESQTPAVIRG
ncbi:hypothetical protein PHISCL_02701, partial [Aspergillus sclerotialis]